MTAPRDINQLIDAFLEEGRDELSDHAYDAVRSQVDHTRQRVVIGPWREEQMFRYASFAVAAAAIVLVAVIGIRFLPKDGGIGGQPTPTPPPTTSAPLTATPSPTPTPVPISDPQGRLQPGTYVAHPFANDPMGFTFTVTSNHWEAVSDPGRTYGIAWVGDSGTEDSGGLALGFLRVGSLNADPCKWSGTADDKTIGPTAQGLWAMLIRQTDYATGEQNRDYISNVTGQWFEITMLSPLPSGCDDNAYRIWNAEGFDIYAQGPGNVWRVGVFEVSGRTATVLVSRMPDTPDAEFNELMDIYRSINFEP